MKILEALRVLVDTLAAGLPFETAFEEASGEPLETFEAQREQWAGGKSSIINPKCESIGVGKRGLIQSWDEFESEAAYPITRGRTVQPEAAADPGESHL